MINDRKTIENEDALRRAEFLHRSVSESLRERLLKGCLAVGSKLPALRELASELSVSTMTVQRALRTLENEGHVYRIAGVGSFVRPNRTGLRRIAMVSTDLTSPFQMAMVQAVQRAAHERGWTVQLVDTHWDLEYDWTNIRRLPASGVTGALLLPPFSDPRMAQALATLENDRFAMVLLDMSTSVLQADLATSNNEAGAYMATRYLLDRGHRRVLFLSHPLAVSSVMARTDGYHRAMASLGIQPSPEWKVWSDLHTHVSGCSEGRVWWGGCRAILPLLRCIERPLAVLAVDSYTGWGVYQACRELNLRIPQDVSVIAFDDVELTRVLTPPMTVISQRTDEIARAGLELLDSRLRAGPPTAAGRRELRQVLIDVNLIERDSVARLPI
jgi:LacI family transcriptional regulator